MNATCFEGGLRRCRFEKGLGYSARLRAVFISGFGRLPGRAVEPEKSDAHCPEPYAGRQVDVAPWLRRTGVRAAAAVLLLLFCWAAWARCEVRVFIQEHNGLACVRYSCDAGEVVRAFALDVTVDRGTILGVSNYCRGLSMPEARGYGLFPSSFRDRLSFSPATNFNWDAIQYAPLAVPADASGDTLPGLNSSGVTLEFGALWNLRQPDAVPGPTGTLCSLRLSEAAQVSIAAEATRGGVVSANPNLPLVVIFTGAWVNPVSRISGVSVRDGVIRIEFKGGELETASSITGPWSGTGDATGHFEEPVRPVPARFYRVRRP